MYQEHDDIFVNRILRIYVCNIKIKFVLNLSFYYHCIRCSIASVYEPLDLGLSKDPDFSYHKNIKILSIIKCYKN